MNSRIAIGLMLGLALVLVGVSAATTVTDLDLVLSSQNPNPVEPGEVVNVEVELQNNGLNDANNIVLEIEPNAPFSLVEGEEQKITYNKISGSSSIKKTFKLLVTSTANSGDYTLDFRYYNQGETAITVRQSVVIHVQGRPNLVIRKITTDPENIEPGKEFELNVMLENVGTGKLFDMQAILNSSSAYILPVLSGGLNFIGDMEPEELKEAKFTMSVDTGAEYKTYSGSLILSYNNEANTMGTKTFALGLAVKGMPIIEILSAKVDGSNYKVDIENIGTSDAKALKVSFVQNGEVRDVSVTNELKPSKAKTLRFSGFEYGQAIINISYLDESNSPHVIETPVVIKQSSAISEESGGAGAYSGLIPVLLVIVVLESFYIWRMKRKKK
ncbi:MAG: COG1361 S-layer family protein [Candidatus Aenigmarchaeota archaeon]|nr:COG1361 S-layer family protein [Candidatus Aenigmarchaeota archaeon]